MVCPVMGTGRLCFWDCGRNREFVCAFGATGDTGAPAVAPLCLHSRLTRAQRRFADFVGHVCVCVCGFWWIYSRGICSA